MEQLLLSNKTSYELIQAGFSLNENESTLAFDLLTTQALSTVISDFSNEANTQKILVKDDTQLLNEYTGYTVLDDKFVIIANYSGKKTLIKLKLHMPAIQSENVPATKYALEYAVKNMPDDHALNCVGAFPEYEIGHSYKVDDRFQYQGNLFKVVQAHTSQADWAPDTTKSLYVALADPSIEYPEFKQPTGGHDAYKNGDKVTYNGKKYVSTIDSNVWAPDAYPQGWKEVK